MSRRRLEGVEAELSRTALALEGRKAELRRRGDVHLGQVQALTAELKLLERECAGQSERLGRAVKLLEEVRIAHTQLLSDPPKATAHLHVGWESGRRSLLADLERKRVGA